MTRPAHQSGSIMFYILITIALIAMLTAYMARGNRTQESTLTSEQAKLAAQEIIDYGSALANAVQKLRLRGVDETTISFQNFFIAAYTNANCTSGSCKIFDPAGGTLNYTVPRDEWLNPDHNASSTYKTWFITGNLAITNIGTDSPDLLLFLPYLNESICNRINALLGLPNPAEDDTYSGSVGWFNGQASDYTAAASPFIGDTDTSYAGKNAFCFRRSTDQYHFVQTLLAR